MSADTGQLTRLLSDELATLRALAAALDSEHNALLSSDVGALEAATTAKNTAIHAHQAQQSERLAWMQARQLSADLPPRELVRVTGDAPEALRLQAQLAELAASCQDSNRRNGVLIVRLQERTRGALEVLRKEDTGTDLYSLSGAREHRSDSRTLGKA